MAGLLMLACGTTTGVVPTTPVARTPGAPPPEVLVGEQLSDHFTGLQALNTRDGQDLWRERTDPSLRGPQWLLVAGGVVYTDALEDAFAFAADGSGPLWHTSLHFLMDAMPALVDGTLYGTSSSPCQVPGSGNCVYALGANDGALRWTYNADAVGGLISPKVANGLVYTAAEDGSVYGLDAQTGGVVWQTRLYKTADIAAPTLEVADSMVFVGGGNGRLYALDGRTGRTRWIYQSTATDPTPTLPAVPRVTVAAGQIYVATARDAVAALDARTGAPRWTHATRGGVLEAPALSGGTLYATTAGDGVYALNSGTGAERWHVLAAAVLRGPASVVGTTVYCVTFDEGDLYALGTRDGATLWRAPARSPGALVHDVTLLGVAGGAVFALDGADAPSVSAWDAATGAARWRRSPPVGIVSLVPAVLVA